jgi:AAA domain
VLVTECATALGANVCAVLLVIFGPPAVGKMTVGRALCARSVFRLFHNHMTIEPLAETFGHGTPQFNRLNAEFRRRVFEEAAAADLDLVFTYVWALDDREELPGLRAWVAMFHGDVAFVELRSDLGTRLQRNRTEGRLADKRSKRDLDWSDENLRSLEHHQFASTTPSPADELLNAYPHLVIDNTDLTPDETATQVLQWLDTVSPITT